MANTYTRHLASDNFVWQDAGGTSGGLSAAQLESYNQLGYFVLDEVFTPQETAAVIAAIDPLEAETEAFLQTRKNGAFGISRAGEITFHTHLVARSPMLREFSCHPVLLAVIDELIGGRARLYWDQSVYKKPGTQRDFPWHQDNGYTFLEPQQYVTCWIALTDATPDNGAPWVMPGVHKQGTLQHRLTENGFACFDNAKAVQSEAISLSLKAGSIAVFSSLTPHRTGANLTTQTRKSYILQYAPDGALAYPRLAAPRLGAADDSPLGPGVLCNDAKRQYVVLDAASKAT